VKRSGEDKEFHEVGQEEQENRREEGVKEKKERTDARMKKGRESRARNAVDGARRWQRRHTLCHVCRVWPCRHRNARLT
jgi:hypothetical protein